MLLRTREHQGTTRDFAFRLSAPECAPAKAGAQYWVPAFAGTQGDCVVSFVSQRRPPYAGSARWNRIAAALSVNPALAAITAAHTSGTPSSTNTT